MINKVLPVRASRYIILEFIKMFLLMIFSAFMIIFIVNFLEFSGKIQKYSIPPISALKIITYKIPSILEVMILFIIVLTTVFTLTKLYSRNELIILYSSGLSPWSTLITIISISFMIGIFNITLFNLFSVSFYNKSEQLTSFFKGRDIEMSYINPEDGIWLNLKNNANNYELIIRSDDVITEKLSFNVIIVVIYDIGGNFVKKIEADKMSLTSNNIILDNVFISEIGKEIKNFKKLKIPVNINEDFIKKQLKNKYENINMIPFLKLNKIIEDYKLLNFDVNKFIVKKYIFISTPFLYIFLVFTVFLILEENQRSKVKILNTINIIIISIIIFALQNTILELSLSKKISKESIFYFVLVLYISIYHKLIEKIEL